MGFLSRIGFIEQIANFLKVDYLVAFIILIACVLIVLILIICIFVLAGGRGKKKTRKEKKAFESGQKNVAEVFYARDPAAEGLPLLPIDPGEKPQREIESSYKVTGGAIPIKPDISDNELFDIIYAEIVSKREDISKNAFLADKNFSQAYLDYVKERLTRLQLRGLSTREALDVYFYGAPLVITARREQPVLSELERQTIKQQKIRALEADIQTIVLHITAIEKTIEGLNETLAACKNKKQKTEIRRKIAELNKELELTRRQLALMREKETSERQKEDASREEEKQPPAQLPAQKQPAAEQPAQPAAQPVAAPVIQPYAQPVIQPVIQPAPQPIVFSGAPQPVYAVQYVNYAQRAELMAELKALILLVNESHVSVSGLELKNAELSLKRENIRGQLSKLNHEAMKTSSDIELDRNMEAAQNLNGELNSLILDMEICAGDKAQLSKDIYNAYNRINGVIAQLGLTYQDVLKIEDELLAGGKGVMKSDGGADWAKRFETARAELNSYFNDEKERARSQNKINADTEEMDGLRKEYMRRMREMEEERIAFFRDYAKSAHDQNSPDRQIKPNAQVPPGYVMLRRKDGSIVMVKRSGLPKSAKSVSNVPERVVKTLPDGSVIRADGSMVRADGRVMRPVKTKDETTKEFREIVMAERRELQRQKEEVKQKTEEKRNDPLDDEINKIEDALKTRKKGK